MATNSKYFKRPLLRETDLAARGFRKDGSKSGGIIDPAPVTIPAGANLFRFYHKHGREYGEWWVTGYEVSVIVEHFGREAGAFGTGRDQGKGILHATLAVRLSWNNMGKFLVARLNEPLQAYHGEGDHAPDASFANMQKAIRIVDDTGRQRLGRQLFLPKAKEYQSAFSIVHFGESDTGLTKALAIYDTNKQLFEV